LRRSFTSRLHRRAISVRLLHLQNLRLDAFDGLADLSTQSDLPHGEFPERQENPRRRLPWIAVNTDRD
jgi:hypothetical protein